MNGQEISREKVEQELVRCENRLHELVRAGKGGDREGQDLEAISGELKSCRLELNELENSSGDDWEEAKHGVVKRLGEVRKSLGLSARKLI